jgi:predicted DsbA family dithiol-disulfide isomerase
MSENNTLKIEIWSDIMCPFCYIGKRNFEKALSQIEDTSRIEVEWKSFQLDPTIPNEVDPSVSAIAYLAEKKGITLEHSQSLHDNVIQMAANVGLNYDYSKAIVANSFNAHKLIQLAKTKQLGDQAEESLFKAYFTEGKNVNNIETLVQLGLEIGLEKDEIENALIDASFDQLVKKDLSEAQQIGVTGVPFFVFNRKYAISGAQPSETFVSAIQQTIDEISDSANTCTPGGNCC